MKRIMTAFLSLILLFTALFSYAPHIVYADEDTSTEVTENAEGLSEQLEEAEQILSAEETQEETDQTHPVEETQEEELPSEEEVHPFALREWKQDTDEDRDELIKGYINKRLYGELVEMEKDPVNLFDTYEIESRHQTGKKLTDANAVLYEEMMKAIEEIASGQRTSTVISVSSNLLNLEKNTWTAQELGLETITEDSIDLVYEIIGFSFDELFHALLYDNPYAFYWFDKTKGVSYSGPGRYNSSMVQISGDFTFWFEVAEEYAGSEDYTVDTSAAETIDHAINKAQSIVDAYKNSSDLDKLYGYKNEICDLVSYNTAAAEGGIAYGNPWQLIWIFDEDASTNVVCEGYSKAFQYLCDLTSFDRNDICAYCVDGTMSGGTGAGNHMWNILHMDDHNNYLVDVTNCDSGSVGADDKLFLVGIGENGGSVEEGYTFIANNVSIVYQYSDDTRQMFSADELSIVQGSYSGPAEEESKAYAVLLDGGELLFFRSTDTYENNSEQSVRDIEGNTYQGIVFADFEQQEEITFASDVKWSSVKTQVTSVSIPNSALIHPLTTRYWFYGFDHLTSVDLSGLNTSDVAEATFMFGNCSSLESLDFDQYPIDTSSFQYMNRMFSGCSNLAYLNISCFDTSNIQGMAGLFENCSSLTSVVLGENFHNWSADARLPEGTWTKDSLALSETELQEGFEDNASEWAGTWNLWKLKETPSLSIRSENGDVIISGDADDQNYIDYINELTSNADNYLYIVDPDVSSRLNIVPAECIGSGNAELDEQYSFRIYQDALIRYGVVNGVHNFEIFVDGYEDLTIENIDLQNVCLQAPNADTEFDSDSNLLLRSADPNWISAYDHEGSYLIIRTTDGTDGWYFGLTDVGAYADGDCIVVSKDALINEQIADGYYDFEVRLYGYGSLFIEDVYLSGYGIQYDINVTQLENGDVHLYSSVDGLIASCKNQQMEVVISNDRGTYYINNGYNTNSRELYSNLYFSVETDANGKEYILISYEDLKGHHVSSGESTFDLGGYSGNVITLSACKEVPDGLNAYEEGDDLLISGDPQFLQALTLPTSRNWGNNNKLTAFYGGHVQFSSGNPIRNIDDSENGIAFDSIRPLVYDESSGTVRISSNVLKGRLVTNDENASVELCANGYETVTISVDGGISLGCKEEAVTFSIEQNEAGDIIITSDNEEWLQNLTVTAERNNAGNSVYGSNIYLSQSEGSSYMSLRNEIYKGAIMSSPMVSEALYYTTDEQGHGYVYVPYDYVKKQNLSEGTVFDSVYANVLGFANTDTSGLTLTIHKSSDPAPESIQAEELENGDIKVTSSDLVWLEKVATPLPSPNRYNYVLIKPESKSYGTTFGNYPGSTYDALIFNGEYLLVNHLAILSSRITSGKAQLTFYAEGYKASEPIDILLNHACLPAPENVEASSDEYGDLIISCPDTNWIETMVYGSEEYDNYYQRRIMIFDENGNYVGDLYSGYGDYNFRISDDHTSFTIPNRMIRDRGISAGIYDLEFYTYGFDGVKLDSVTFNEFVDREAEEIIENTSSQQDGDTKGLRITSSCSEWLTELASMLDSEKYLYFQSGSIRLDEAYVTFEYEGDVITGLVISYEALLENHIAPGDTAITFPATANYPSVTLDLGDTIVESCQAVPSGLKALETQEGIRLYFDNTGEEEIRFLKALLKETVFKYNTGITLQKGSAITVSNEDYSMSYHFDNWKNFDPDSGETKGSNSRVFLSEDETYVYIPSEVILNESTLYNTDDLIRFNIEAYGYTAPDYSIEIQGLKYAKTALKEDFVISASLDDEKNLIIRSNDQDWIEALGKFTIYDEYETISEHGSYFAMIRADEWKYIHFSHDHHTGYQSASENSYELRTDETSGEKYIFVSRDSLIERFGDAGESDVVGKKYYFEFSPYGYQGYRSSADKEGEYVQFTEDLVRTVPELNIYENENGDLVIEAVELNDDYSAYLDSFLNGEKNYIGVRCKDVMYVFYPPAAYNSTNITVSDQKMIISNDLLMDRNIENGSHEIVIKTVGYSEYRKDVVMQKVCTVAPGDIVIAFDEQDNLVVTSADLDYLKALAEGSIYFRGSKYRDTAGKEMLELLDNKVILKKDDIVSMSIPDDDYVVELQAYHYGAVEKNLHISGYLKTLTAEVNVYMEAGDLIISSEDSEFLNALVTLNVSEFKESVYRDITRGGKIILTIGGRYIYFQNDKYMQDDNVYESYPLEVKDGRIVISNKDLRNNSNIYDCDDAKVTLTAPGYESQIFENIVISNVRGNFVPDDVKVVLEENGDLIITSAYTDWLKALCVETIDEPENYVTGGLVIFRNREHWYGLSNEKVLDHIRVEYLEEEGAVKISADTIKRFDIVNGEYEVRLRPYLYVEEGFGSFLIENGAKQPSGEVSVSVDEDQNIVIYCEDEDYLKSFLNSEESYTEIYDDNKNYHIDHSMFVLENGSMYIKKKTLVSLGVQAGEYRILLSSYDYTDHTKTITLPELGKEPTDEVYVSAQDGSLIIQCEDADFLTALTKTSVYEGNTLTEEGGYIEVTCDDGNIIRLTNRRYTATGNEIIDYRIDGNKIIVDNNTMLSYGITDSETAIAELYAPGYQLIIIDQLVIRNALNPNVPGDIDIHTEENGDLVITSSDMNWLKAICEPNIHEDTPASSGGKIILKKQGSEAVELFNTNDETVYSFKDGKVVLTSEKQIELKLYNDFYDITIEPYKYPSYEADVPVYLTGGYGYEPEDVSIELMTNGIVITCSDVRWRQFLVNDERSIIKLKNDENEYFFKGSDFTANGNTLILSMRKIREASVKGGTYTLYLYPYAYDGSYANNIVIIDPADLKPQIKVSYNGAELLQAGSIAVFTAEIQASDDYIESWDWTFSDGTTDTGKQSSHVFDEAGKYEVQLKVTDIYGDAYENKISVEVIDCEKEDSQYTVVNFNVLNSDDASTVANVLILLESEEESYEVRCDEYGYAQAVLKNGSYTVSAAAQGYMVRTFTMDLAGGYRDQMISLYATSIMSGEITVREMTLEEIKEAGIDIDAPGNQHVFEFTTTFTFTAGLTEYEVSYPTYKNENDIIVGIRPAPIHINIGGGGGQDDDDKGGKTVVTVYPISEKFAMVVYGEAHWLKEMFQVSLVVNNDSATDTLEQTTAVLDLPEGMSLADMVSEPQNKTIDLGTIDKKGSANATWYVRGDAEGDYYIGAHVSALDMPFGTVINEEFETSEPVHVYAGSALHLSIILDDVAKRGEDYTVRYRLENVTNKSLYNLSFGIKGCEQFKVIGYSDHTQTEEQIEGMDFGDEFIRYVEELAPKGYIEMQLATTLWFESDLEYLRYITFFGDYIDISYYAENVSLVELSESTTSIPYDVVINKTPRERLINHVMDVTMQKILGDRMPQTMGDFVIEVVGDTLGLPTFLKDAAKTQLKLQKGSTDYTMRISIDDGVEENGGIQNEVIRIHSADGAESVVDLLNTEIYSISTEDAIIEARHPGKTTMRISLLDQAGEIISEYVQEVIVDAGKIYDVLVLDHDESTDRFTVNKQEMADSAQRVKEETIEALLINPFQVIPTYVEYVIDEADNAFKAQFYNDDKSGGGVLDTLTHQNILINSNTAVLDFDRQAWQSIAEASEDTFEVSLSDLTSSGEDPVYRIEAGSEDKELGALNGKVHVCIPFALSDPANIETVYVERIGNDGKTQNLYASYDEEKGELSFDTDTLGDFVIHETEPEIRTLTLDKEEMEMTVGDMKQLSVLEGTKVIWTSEDESIASVNENGMVSALSAGTTLIRATASDDPTLYASCLVKVSEYVDPFGEILIEDRPDDPNAIPKGFWTSELIYDERDPNKEIRYTGSPITMSFRVYDHNKLLHEGDDYTVKYANNTKAGKASITITGKGNYTGTLVKEFVILPAQLNMEETVVLLNKDVFVENGKAQKPTVTVVHRGVTLKNKSDYTVEYELDGNTILPKEYWVKVHGEGNYEGEITRTYRIYDDNSFVSVSGLKITGIKNAVYTGEEILQEIRVFDGKTELVKDEDYTVSYQGNVNAGTAYVTIEGTMNLGQEGRPSYAGTLSKPFKITQAPLSAKTTEVYGLEEALDFTGEAITQDLLLMYNDSIVLEEGIDYTLTYKNNIKAGTAAITIKGINNFKGSFAKKFTINKVEISEDDVDYSNTAEYMKGGVKPEPVIKVNGRQLTLNSDYTLSYKNNSKLGEATMTIKGKGSYLGSVTLSFEIVQRNISDVSITIPDKVYSPKGNAWKSNPVLTDSNGKKLAAGTDYSKNISYMYYADTEIVDGSNKSGTKLLRKAGEEVQKNDILPVNALIEVSVNTDGLKVNNYTGETSGIYRIIEADIAKANISVPVQYFTGSEIYLNEEDLTVKIGNKILTPFEDYEIELDSYLNNAKIGTAKVTIRGKGTYGGAKTISFKIAKKSMGLTFRFMGNGATTGNMSDLIIYKDAALTKVAYKKVVDKVNIPFVEWNTQRDGNGISFTNGQMINYEEFEPGTIITLYAIWKQ